MSNAAFQRLALITGEAAVETLQKTNVFIFGLGGVGSWCAEALCRSAVGNITLADSDTICVTNINRQIQALPATIGKYKAEVLRERLLSINPDCDVTAHNKIFSKETSESFLIENADYVIDAIDSLSCKITLIETACNLNKKIFSCMGMAQKLDPLKITTADIWKTHGCPLARLVRTELRKRKFAGHFTAVYSPERLPLRGEIAIACKSANCLCPKGGGADAAHEWCSSKKIINGSAVTVTAAAGFALASLVINDVI